jgi:glycosyltransferase involved in cell wall biosynthesis
MTFDRPLMVLAWPSRTGPDGNPFIDLLYGPMLKSDHVQVTEFSNRRLALQTWDIVHIHWPEWALTGTKNIRDRIRGLRFLFLLHLARGRGARVVWTAHNVTPHEATGPVSTALMRMFVRSVDMVVYLSSATRLQARQVYPPLRLTPDAIVPHGHYRGVYSDLEHQSNLLPDSQSTGRVLLLIGQLRPYKNAVELIRYFRAVALPDDRLVVAGRPASSDLEGQIITATASDNRVTLVLRHIADQDVSPLIRSSDVVILPYRAVTNSGAALLALSYGRPVMAPAEGSFPELAATIGPDWVHTYEGSFNEAAVKTALTFPLPTGEPDLSSLDWDTLSERLLCAFRSARSTERPSLRQRIVLRRLLKEAVDQPDDS